MMADLGLQAYRFSISWSRVLPDGRGKPNEDGLACYSKLVDLLLDHGITPERDAVPLGPPSELEALGGFRNRDTASYFADYATLMVRELGDRVSMWATFNEPWCHAYLGHAAGVHAPGLRDPTRRQSPSRTTSSWPTATASRRCAPNGTSCNSAR